MIRVGLVGAGPWAEMFHAPMLAAAPGLNLAAVWARRPEAAAALAEQYGTTAVRSFDEFLDGVDAVSFCVPPDVQGELAIIAAAAGKHLLLEKPIAATLASAEALAGACDEAGVTTLVALRNRFGRPVRTFLEATDRAVVRAVTTQFVSGSTLSDSPFATPWRVAAPHALLDLGPHALDLTEAVAGPIVEIDAAGSAGVLSITTRHTTGVRGHVVLSASTPNADDRLHCDAITDTGPVGLTDPDAQPQAEVRAEIADQFARSIRGELAQPLDVHRGLAVQRLMAAVDASLATGRPAAV